MSRAEPASLYQAIRPTPASADLSRMVANTFGIQPDYARVIHGDSLSPTSVPLLLDIGANLRSAFNSTNSLRAGRSTIPGFLQSAFAQDISREDLAGKLGRLLERFDKAALPWFTTNVLHEDPADLIITPEARQNVAAAIGYYPEALNIFLSAGQALSQAFPDPAILDKRVVTAYEQIGVVGRQRDASDSLRDARSAAFQLDFARSVLGIYTMIPQVQSGQHTLGELRRAFIRLAGSMKNLADFQKPVSPFVPLVLDIDGVHVEIPEISVEILAMAPANLVTLAERVRKTI